MSLSSIKRLSAALLSQPGYAPLLALLVITGDALLTQLIIRFIRCKLDPPIEPKVEVIDMQLQQTRRSTGKRICTK